MIPIAIIIAVIVSFGIALLSSIDLPADAASQGDSDIIEPVCVPVRESKAPVVTSDGNVYVTWWSNKTGNDEVLFRASNDNGLTFGDKINLSNTTTSESADAEIAADGDMVYVTWWERNSTDNEPVLRISNDGGQTFAPILELSVNGSNSKS